MSERLTQLFRQACGMVQPAVLELARPGGPVARHRIAEEPFAVAGRDPRCHLLLRDEAVSQRHAYFQLVAGRVFCLDLGSRTGIHWDEGLRPFGWLGPGEGVRIGPFLCRLREDGPGAEGTSSPDGGDSLRAWRGCQGPPPALVLEFRDGVRWRLHGPLTLVGRSPRCDVRPADLSVSRFHCCLLHTPRGAWAIDLLSREGTRVDGKPRRWAPLPDGARLQIGTLRARVWYGEPASPAADHAKPGGPRRLLGQLSAGRGMAAASSLPAPFSGVAAALVVPHPGEAAAGPGPTGWPSGPGGPDLSSLVALLMQLPLLHHEMLSQLYQEITRLKEAVAAQPHHLGPLVQEQRDRLEDLAHQLQDLKSRARGLPLPAASPEGLADPIGGPEGGGLSCHRERGQAPPRDPCPSAGGKPPAFAAPLPGAAGRRAVGTGHAGQAASAPGSPGAGQAGEPYDPVWLLRRAHEVGREQKGRWRKLLAYLLGG